MGGFIVIWKPTPAADIVNENCLVPGIATYDVLQQIAKRRAVLYDHTTLPGIRVSLHNQKAVAGGIFLTNGATVCTNPLLASLPSHAAGNRG